MECGVWTSAVFVVIAIVHDNCYYFHNVHESL